MKSVDKASIERLSEINPRLIRTTLKSSRDDKVTRRDVLNARRLG